MYTKLKEAEAIETHMKVYKKEDIPDDLHYKNHYRITPIVIVADNGWLLKRVSKSVSEFMFDIIL